jgi:hypothetical protein
LELGTIADQLAHHHFVLVLRAHSA